LGVIDLAQTRKTGTFVDKALKKFGLPDLNSAVAALASTIRDHKHFETLLTSTAGEERQMLYDSCVPHLKFTAKPLDVYVAGAGQMAERLQLPTLDAEGNLHEFRPAADVKSIEKAAQQAIADDLAARTLTLVCSKCRHVAIFTAFGHETPVDVIKKARKIGWVYDYTADREICPKCPTSLRPNA
jgi:hypothetical protein